MHVVQADANKKNMNYITLNTIIGTNPFIPITKLSVKQIYKTSMSKIEQTYNYHLETKIQYLGLLNALIV